MDIKEIKEIIKRANVSALGVKREYSVLIPIMKINGELNIIYELRAKDMPTQPGEVSFPGGARENNESFLETAIRETCEELNISEENIEIFGEIDSLISTSGVKIHCFVGEIININFENIKPNPKEVDHIFPIAIDYLMENEPKTYSIRLNRTMAEDFPFHLIPNGENYKWREHRYDEVFYKHTDYKLWGFTARMTHNFINILKNNMKGQKVYG